MIHHAVNSKIGVSQSIMLESKPPSSPLTAVCYTDPTQVRSDLSPIHQGIVPIMDCNPGIPPIFPIRKSRDWKTGPVLQSQARSLDALALAISFTLIAINLFYASCKPRDVSSLCQRLVRCMAYVTSWCASAGSS